jgi:cell division septation protein DedD
VTEPHHEPSYYEIALTNRQVVVAFVILLACLLAAFFSGVWIGRGGVDLHRDQMVRATPPPQPPSEGRTLEELKFFADRPNKKGGKHEEKATEVAPAPAPPVQEEKPVPAAPAASESRRAAASAPSSSTLQQDIDQGRQALRTPPASSSAKSRRTPAAPVVRSTPPAPAPDETAAEEPARPEPVQTRPSSQPGGGTVVIQVFASSDQAEASRVRDRLGKGGQSAFLSPITVDGRTMYRVRIGPFPTRPKAQQVAEKVRKNFKLDTWLTQ